MQVFGAIKQLTGGKMGPAGLFIGGSARMVHVSSYVVAQFLIYDSIKRLCGIPVAGVCPPASNLIHTHTSVFDIFASRYVGMRMLAFV